MPRSPYVCCLMLLCLGELAQAAQTGTYIEQTVVTDAISGQPAMQGVQKIWFTATHIRNEVSFGKHTSVAIIDLKNNRIVLIPTEEKQYLEMNLSDYQRIVAMRLSGTGLNDPKADPKLEKTDEQKQIGDWQCTRYLFEQGGRVRVKSELWVSAQTGVDFASYLDLMKKLGTERILGKLSQFVEKIDGYPVETRTEQFLDGQKVISSQKLTKVARGPVDPSLFEVPKGYKRIQDDTLNLGQTDKGDR